MQWRKTVVIIDQFLSTTTVIENSFISVKEYEERCKQGAKKERDMWSRK